MYIYCQGRAVTNCDIMRTECWLVSFELRNALLKSLNHPYNQNIDTHKESKQMWWPQQTKITIKHHSFKANFEGRKWGIIVVVEPELST